jgi:hypothetical protein
VVLFSWQVAVQRASMGWLYAPKSAFPACLRISVLLRWHYFINSKQAGKPENPTKDCRSGTGFKIFKNLLVKI